MLLGPFAKSSCTNKNVNYHSLPAPTPAITLPPWVGLQMKARILLLVAFAFLCRSTIFGDQGHHHTYNPDEKLGTVSFPISCAPEVQKPFERGVALMHSFWYEEAEKQFAEIAAKDPHCAMADWGEALSLWHQLWERPDDAKLKRGWALVQHAQAANAKTQREQGYISAVAAFYQPNDKLDFMQRANAYSSAMEKVYRALPDDHEAAAFYALSLLAAAPPRDDTFTNQKKAIAILQQLFDEQPDHPGAAHYLIHSCDSPQLAPLALAAARRYALIAPASPHAVHMPSHIFARLGLWQEDIQSNLASVAATQKASEMQMGGAAHALHALDFLEYAYLQVGDDAKSKGIVDQLGTMQQMDMGDGMHGYLDMARVPSPRPTQLSGASGKTLRLFNLLLEASPTTPPSFTGRKLSVTDISTTLPTHARPSSSTTLWSRPRRKLLKLITPSISTRTAMKRAPGPHSPRARTTKRSA